MNQQNFATKTELFPEETGTSFRQSTNAPDAEVYFGGAAIRLKKKRPKSLWEDRAAEACRILHCLGHSDPDEVLEKIGEILGLPPKSAIKINFSLFCLLYLLILETGLP